ncbi:MAG: hypothetical protein KF812_10385 [Fimbriimonadaceae bacterium]|nr:hypothetical protein [Fimbriimonadaceae bacterium]
MGTSNYELPEDSPGDNDVPSPTIDPAKEDELRFKPQMSAKRRRRSNTMVVWVYDSDGKVTGKHYQRKRQSHRTQ